jgi:ABC-type dipeptide/oligopeptide/nickel transport system permease component
MLVFLLRRIGLIIPTFVGVTLLSFMLIHLVPGDPIEVRAGEHGIAPERLAELRHQFGLDQPLWKQFFDYEVQLLHGDLGTSVSTHETVWNEFTTLFPATLELGLCAILFAVIVGLPLGVIAATRRGLGVRLWADRAVRHRGVDADLLVGADGDPGVLRGPRLDAGLRADLGFVLYRALVWVHADRLLVRR